MAYNPTPPPTSPISGNKRGNKLTRGKPSRDKPFVEEVEPTPSPALGDIKFQKIIYSQNAFRKKVDVSISELKSKEEEIDIPKFFANYHKIFFDIPQKGINSHSTLIKESLDFVNNYVDYKDEQIEDLNQQIVVLNQQIIDLQTADVGGENEEITEEIESQAIKIKADAEIGNVNDPFIYWSQSSDRLLYTMGLKKTAKHAKDNKKLPDGSDPFEEGNQNQLKKDTDQSYEKGGSSNIRQNQEIRTYSEWKSDTEKRSSGGETRDIKRMLDYIREVTVANYNSITS
tara:strand:+ start:99 stop:956 length:858 start_codon:yes stop_codon:yes gene_type:complete